jgi:hypothetical protein
MNYMIRSILVWMLAIDTFVNIRKKFNLQRYSAINQLVHPLEVRMC